MKLSSYRDTFKTKKLLKNAAIVGTAAFVLHVAEEFQYMYAVAGIFQNIQKATAPASLSQEGYQKLSDIPMPWIRNVRWYADLISSKRSKELRFVQDASPQQLRTLGITTGKQKKDLEDNIVNQVKHELSSRSPTLALNAEILKHGLQVYIGFDPSYSAADKAWFKARVEDAISYLGEQLQLPHSLVLEPTEATLHIFYLKDICRGWEPVTDCSRNGEQKWAPKAYLILPEHKYNNLDLQMNSPPVAFFDKQKLQDLSESINMYLEGTLFELAMEVDEDVNQVGWIDAKNRGEEIGRAVVVNTIAHEIVHGIGLEHVSGAVEDKITELSFMSPDVSVLMLSTEDRIKESIALEKVDKQKHTATFSWNGEEVTTETVISPKDPAMLLLKTALAYYRQNLLP